MGVNRMGGGLHFPVDSAGGLVLGQTLAEFFNARFCGCGDPESRTFDGRGFEGDFCYEKILSMSHKPKNKKGKATADDSDGNIANSPARTVGTSRLLQYLWEQAIAEWQLMIGT